MNRYGINRVTRLFANRIPPFVMMVHRGRTSGRMYHTPIMAFPTEKGVVIALTYGRDTDWEKNVFAASNCEMIRRGQTLLLANPRHIPEAEASQYLPGVIRNALRLMRVHDFLRLDASPIE
jgi:deazaflavin-dependent oxidoreductase (nitroreductase family)